MNEDGNKTIRQLVDERIEYHEGKVKEEKANKERLSPMLEMKLKDIWYMLDLHRY